MRPIRPQFPEQLDDEYLRTWQPVKLYYNTGRVGSFSIPTGDISPSRFMSYAEIKSLALRNFRSQGFDRRAHGSAARRPGGVLSPGEDPRAAVAGRPEDPPRRPGGTRVTPASYWVRRLRPIP